MRFSVNFGDSYWPPKRELTSEPRWICSRQISSWHRGVLGENLGLRPSGARGKIPGVSKGII